MSPQSDDRLISALSLTQSRVKVIGFRQEVYTLHPVDAIALVRRYPQSWTSRTRPSGVKWIRAIAQYVPKWEPCWRTTRAAVCPVSAEWMASRTGGLQPALRT